MGDVTRILSEARNGEPTSAKKLLPLIYEELRKLAASKLSHESPDLTLQATALVHEAYVRLVEPADQPCWDNRGHFFAAAAEAMRRILVDNARRRQSLKRGGGFDRKEIDLFAIAAPETDEKVLALSDSLDRLGVADPIAAELVKLRYFAGLTCKEAALAMGLSERSADRIWVYARAWLFKEIKGG